MKNIKTFEEHSKMNESKVNEGRIRVKDHGYWSETGTYQEEYERLYTKYVPSDGSSKDKPWGELLRMSSRLAYDWYNNGFGNDKREEIAYLEKYEKLYIKYLQDKRSFENLKNAWNEEILPGLYGYEPDIYFEDDDDEEFYGDISGYDKELNLWLNDIVDAIVQGMIKARK